MRHPILHALFIKILIAILVALTLIANTSTLDTSVFVSQQPTPDLSFIVAVKGGRIYCGAQQSSAWLEIPSGFIGEEGGANIYCDPARPISALPAANAWDGHFYLIGIYVPQLLKPINIVFEIDRARLDSVCAGCWSGKYYTPGKGWQKLPTTLDKDNARVYVTIADILTISQYPGYTDRFAVALFTQSQQVTPIATKPNKPSPTATTLIPTRTSTKVSIAARPAPLTPTPEQAFILGQVPTIASAGSNQPSSSTVSSTNPTLLIGWMVAGILAIALVVIAVKRK